VSKLTLEWQTDGEKRMQALKDGQQLTIGRHQTCDIVLGDPHVSRRHASIHYRDGRFHVTNLSQTNPVVLNDRWVLAQDLESDLKPGDSLTMGLIRLKVTLQKITSSLKGSGSISGALAT